MRKLILPLLLFSLLSSSCSKYYYDEEPAPNTGGNNNNTNNNPGPAYVQFYMQPVDGYELNYVKANFQNYNAFSTIGSCEHNIRLYADNTEHNTVTFEISLKNYKSLDAAMNGWPYATEKYGSTLYLSDLKPGCNTLEILRSSTNRFVVEVKP